MSSFRASLFKETSQLLSNIFGSFDSPKMLRDMWQPNPNRGHCNIRLWIKIHGPRGEIIPLLLMKYRPGRKIKSWSCLCKHKCKTPLPTWNWENYFLTLCSQCSLVHCFISWVDGHKPMNFPTKAISTRWRAFEQGSGNLRSTKGMSSRFFTKREGGGEGRVMRD